jgi:hypothetical protein
VLDANTINRPRACQDILMAALFVGFIIGVAVITGWSVTNGKPNRLIYGADSWGNICGTSNTKLLDGSPYSGLDLVDYPHEYRTLDNSGRKLCVAKCPLAYTVCAVDRQRCEAAGVCTNVPGSPYTAANDSAAAAAAPVSCPEFAFASSTVSLIQRCAPIASSNGTIASDFAKELNAEADFEELVANFYAARTPILTCGMLAAACSMTFILLMRCCSLLIVYLVIGEHPRHLGHGRRALVLRRQGRRPNRGPGRERTIGRGA